MSELSSVYSEYEKISSLFRRLNEATLVARQSRLGLKAPSPTVQAKVQHGLESALEELNDKNIATSNFAYSDILNQLRKEDIDLSENILNSILRRVRNGIEKLTREDIEVIERVTDVLDSKSELLFRRIQK